MNADSIYQKYMEAVQQVSGDGTWVDWGVVRLALRLAISDAYNGAPFTDLHAMLADREHALQNALDQIDSLRSQRNAQPDLRTHENLQAQISRINEWLAEHAPALYRNPDLDTGAAVLAAIATLKSALEDNRDDLRQQLAAMDADNAELVRQLRLAQAEIDRLTRQNVIAVDAFNSRREMTPATNGAGPTADEPLSANTWYQHLDPETDDWRVSIEAGRRTFRQVPKAQRLLLAQAVARHVGGGRLPKQTDFDLGKPEWMPGGGGLAQAFGCNWAELLTMTPFEVAP